MYRLREDESTQHNPAHRRGLPYVAASMHHANTAGSSDRGCCVPVGVCAHTLVSAAWCKPRVSPLELFKIHPGLVGREAAPMSPCLVPAGCIYSSQVSDYEQANRRSWGGTLLPCGHLPGRFLAAKLGMPTAGHARKHTIPNAAPSTGHTDPSYPAQPCRALTAGQRLPPP